MPKRKQKNYNRPKKPYESKRMEEEEILAKKYGLKKKREIWKAEKYIEKIRNIAKSFITASEEEKQEFINRQKLKGFKVENFSDILSLDKEDRLKRRLQSIVVKRGIAKTPKQARQFIIHKKIAIDKKIINIPSHLTTLKQEEDVELILKNKPKKEEKIEENE